MNKSNIFVVLYLFLISLFYINITGTPNPFVSHISHTPNFSFSYSFSFNCDNVDVVYDSVRFLMENDKRYYWKVISEKYKDSAVSKRNIESFLHETMNISDKETKFNLTHKQRKNLKHRLMQITRAETSYGKHGIGRPYNKRPNGAVNNVVGRKIHGNFYKWNATRASQNNASFEHWTHSVLFYYEKYLSHHKRQI